MGIGQTAFVAHFSVAAEFLTTPSSIAATTMGDLYIDRWRGIGFHKPSSWEWVSVLATRRAQAGIQLRSEDTSLAMNESILSEDTHAPFVVAANLKEAVPTPGALSAEVQSLAAMLLMSFEGTLEGVSGDESVESLEEYLDRDLAVLADNYLGFQLLSEPQPTELSQCEAIEYNARYHLEHSGISSPIVVRDRTIYVLHNQPIYSIRMVDYPDNDPPVTYDFDSIIGSIRLL